MASAWVTHVKSFAQKHKMKYGEALKNAQCKSEHTQASFNTMRYKGRDSASGIDRKLSIIRPGATTIVAP